MPSYSLSKSEKIFRVLYPSRICYFEPISFRSPGLQHSELYSPLRVYKRTYLYHQVHSLSILKIWNQCPRFSNIESLYIWHFQRAISPELLDLNPSFIYQNTPLNVLFKMLGCSSWKNFGFEHSEGDTTDFWRFALGGDTIMRGDIIQQHGVRFWNKYKKIVQSI